jgi:hypothetical protein
MSKLRLPSTLAFVIVSATAATAATVACGGGGDKTDAAQNCEVICVPSPEDAGVIADGGVSCPACANLMNECPPGCDPIPIA